MLFIYFADYDFSFLFLMERLVIILRCTLSSCNVSTNVSTSQVTEVELFLALKILEYGFYLHSFKNDLYVHCGIVLMYIHVPDKENF